MINLKYFSEPIRNGTDLNLADLSNHNKAFLKKIIFSILTMLGAIVSHAQCPTYHNFYLQEMPGGGVRAIYGPSFPNYLDGEFRWYVNEVIVKTQSVGSDY